MLLWRQKRALGVQTSPLFGQKSVNNAPIPVRRRIRTNPGISAETHSSLNSGSKLEKAPTLGKLSPVTQPQKASVSQSSSLAWLRILIMRSLAAMYVAEPLMEV